MAEMSCSEIFQEINKRQIIALMFHDELADLYDFLGMNGFKRMHEYQYFAESAEHRGLKRYYINHHNKLLPEVDIHYDKELARLDWYRYSRMDVTSQAKKQTIESTFEKYNKWETETKQFYEDCAKKLFDMNMLADFNKVNDLIKDVDDELKRLDRLLLSLKACNFNEVYILSIQDGLHDKYKEKSKMIGINIC